MRGYGERPRFYTDHEHAQVVAQREYMRSALLALIAQVEKHLEPEEPRPGKTKTEREISRYFPFWFIALETAKRASTLGLDGAKPRKAAPHA